MKSASDLVINMLKLQEKLFVNVLHEMEDFATLQAGPEATHSAWIAGHALNSRFYMLKLAGGNEKYRFGASHYGRGMKFSQENSYPSVQESLEDLKLISPLLYDQLSKLTDADWDAPAAYAFPLGDSFMDTIAFMAHHEAYHIGQISLMRRAAGLPSMSYK